MNMSNSNGKRRSSDDINLRRKRKRTISNDLLRGLDLTDRIRDPASDSTLDSSTLESEPDSDYLEESVSDGKADTKCTKCDDLSKLFEVHSEILTLLKEIKRDNEKIHKSLSLQMQVCRQEIVEHVRDLKNSVTRMVTMSTNGVHHKDDNENNVSDHHNGMDDESSHIDYDDDDEEYHR